MTGFEILLVIDNVKNARRPIDGKDNVDRPKAFDAWALIMVILAICEKNFREFLSWKTNS